MDFGISVLLLMWNGDAVWVRVEACFCKNRVTSWKLNILIKTDIWYEIFNFLHFCNHTYENNTDLSIVELELWPNLWRLNYKIVNFTNKNAVMCEYIDRVSSYINTLSRSSAHLFIIINSLLQNGIRGRKCAFYRSFCCA